ncbi:MAG: hypothetical protein JWM62_733 [Frankiales bacterium]|nr:hypothetical protein [Frankiales bacterium]
MRNRLVVSALLVAGLATCLPSAGAAPAATLDGKKTKVLTMNANGGVQDHDADADDLLGESDRVDCKAPRCASLPFVYAPAKGVKGGTMLSLTWTSPASDLDLYIAQVGKNGNNTEVAHCGGVGTTSEKIFIKEGTLKAGKTYALIADFYRSVDEDVTGTVTFPAKDGVSKAAPADVDGLVYPVNCTL